MLAPCLRSARSPGTNRPWSSLHLPRPTFRFASTTSIPAPTLKPNKNKWSSTLLLPKTDFPMKHKDPVKAEMQWRDRMTSELYRMQWEKNPGEVFILHDGPPYANGDLHMGEAFRLEGCTYV